MEPTLQVSRSFRSSTIGRSRRNASTVSLTAAAGSLSPTFYPAPDGVKLAAGWLVERAGFGKGYPGDGAPARLSTKHALAVTNRGTATTAELLALARDVRDGVFRVFGVQLVPEPILVGCEL